MTGEKARRDDRDWDIITLSGLKAVANHGVYDFEREGSQDFIADITLFVDARKAAESDNVEDTVDYSKVAEDAVAVLTGPAVFLIETLASKLAAVALTYPGVQRVAVTVHKPMAPLKQQFSDVSVTVVRGLSSVDSPGLPHSSKRVPTENTRPVAPPRPRKRQTSKLLKPAPIAPPKPVTKPEAVAHRAPEVLAVTNLDAPKPPMPTPATGIHLSRANHRRTKSVPTYRDPKRPTKVVYDVVLALGGNRGDTVKTLRGAVDAIANLDGFEVEAVSPLIRTEPVLEKGALPQDDYLNAVVLGRTVMAPPALLAATQKIEADFGRVRTTRWGSRTLDIDIISLDRMRLNTRHLTLPHPRAHERAFVLYPWLQADANAYLAGAGNVSELLEHAPDLSGVLALYPNWLQGDATGGPGEELEVELAPRTPRIGKREQQPTIPARTARLRGEAVTLSGIEGDPIFQKLLEAEQAHDSVSTTAQAGPAEPSVVVPETAHRQERVYTAEASRDEIVHPVRTTTTGTIPVLRKRPRKAAFPSRRSRAQEDASGAVSALPEWDFSTQSQAVRVVDSMEGNEDAAPPTAQVPRVTRDVTIRPTPTGSVPVRRVPDTLGRA